MNYIGIYCDKQSVANGELMEWVFKYCPSYLTNDAHSMLDQNNEQVYHYRFYFEDENDLFLFQLRWSS